MSDAVTLKARRPEPDVDFALINRSTGIQLPVFPSYFGNFSSSRDRFARGSVFPPASRGRGPNSEFSPQSAIMAIL
jgi:hypothetical protein